MVYREADMLADSYVKGWQGFPICNFAIDHPCHFSLRLSDLLLVLPGMAMGNHGNLCMEIEYLSLRKNDRECWVWFNYHSVQY